MSRTSQLGILSLSDTKIITAHLQRWVDLLGKVPPDTTLMHADLEAMIDQKYGVEYRGLLLGALIRWSLSKGLIERLGRKHYIRVGRSRDSAVSLAQIMSLTGLLAEEYSPGNILGYEDVVSEDGEHRERHYSVFCRAIGDSFQWIHVSKPIVVDMEGEKVLIEDHHRTLIARRLEFVLLM